MSGRVVLVGAGPGDPELVTLRAEAELSAAAVVICDAAVEALARRFAPTAEVEVVAGRGPAVATLLATVARSRGPVVRLYAGDPWLHPGHGGELAALQRAGIGAEAVAGVPAEVALPAQAGIPVLVRHLAIACTIASEEVAPVPVDPARTLVVTCRDGAATARRFAADGAAALPAALIPLGPASGDPGARSAPGAACTLGALAGGPTGGPALLVVGAVAGPSAVAHR